MARYKQIDMQPKFLPVDVARQLLPGTFEHAVHHLVEQEIDLTAFDARFRNGKTGAPAYPPALLLKVVLAAYAHGVVSSLFMDPVHRAGSRAPGLLTDDSGCVSHCQGGRGKEM